MKHPRSAFGAFVVAAVLAVPSLALAQAASAPGQPPAATQELPQPDDTNAQRAIKQPYNNAPFWRGVHDSGDNAGFTTLPGREKGVLVQRFTQYPGSRYTNAGEAWRQVRNNWIVPYGGALALIALVALAIWYFARGPLGDPIAPEGARTIERFTPFERAAHWINAIAFVILAISGIVMAFGRTILLPWMGLTLHGWFAYALKNLHNFVGPLFIVSLLVVIVTFVRDELWKPGDTNWMRNVGTVLKNRPEPPSHRFNAGEKIVFWLSAVLLGIVVTVTGLLLDRVIPNLDYTRGFMQITHMVHSTAALGMIAILLVHIYLGTLGVRGAYTAMRTGWVDEHWADEHHKLWADDVRTGKISRHRSKRSKPPAERLTGRPA